MAGFGLLLGAFAAVAPAGSWPLPALGAVVVTGVATCSQSTLWLRLGRPDPTAWVLTGLTAAAAPLALTARFMASRDPSASVEAAADLLRTIPGWSVPIAGLLFAAVNALTEEAVYRGLVQTTLATVVGPAAAVALQGVVFGLAHLHGFPSGVVGVGLATVYGVALGVIRWRSDGLLAPCLAHFIADLAVVVLVAGYLV